MYLFGIKRWYANWILMIISLGVFPLLLVYMFYRVIKELNKQSAENQCAEYFYEELREEMRLEELRKIRNAIEKNK